jgi:apolipoprotein N-acyltransferase
VLPRPSSEPAAGRGADALPRLRLTSRETSRAPPPPSSGGEADVRLRLDPPSPAVALLAGVASGLLVGFSFPPVDAGPLVLVALLPLLWVWRTATPGRGALAGFGFGLACFGVLLEWTRYFGAVAIAPLVLAEAAFVAGTGALVALFVRRGYRSPWLVAAIWVVVEALRARFPLGGLPWGELGVALHDQPWARALASLGGVPLVSFVVVAVNGLLLELLVATRRRRVRPVAFAAGALGLLVLAVGVVGLTRFQPTVTGEIRYALLQGNDQNRNLTAEEVGSDYLFRKHLELASELEGPYDLIVFPESSLERDPTTNRDVRDELTAIARSHEATIVANARVPTGDGGLFNANIAYSPSGKEQGVYAKQHLVPFGEYVPLRDQLSFIGELDQIPYDYEPGDRRVMFRAGGHPMGSVICFESAFAPIVTDYVRDGAELLLVSTNNRSYRRSGLSSQHVALSQMRAAETGRPVLHAAISGISAVVDPDGDVHDESELFVNRITDGTIETTTGNTVYVAIGDWVLVLSGLALIVLAAAAVLRPRAAPVD